MELSYKQLIGGEWSDASNGRTRTVLDPATEEQLLRQLKANTRGRTVIMITHRLAPLAIADRVALVMDGRVERIGPPTEVMAYARIRMAEASRGQSAAGAAAHTVAHALLDEFGHYHFVDTLAKDPAFWSFNSGAVNKISNQFAAMPSVHCAWALWCACAMVPRARRRWVKIAFVLYPVGTVTAIVLTGNHYVLDAVGGFAVLGIGYALARTVTRAGQGPPVPATP